MGAGAAVGNPGVAVSGTVAQALARPMTPTPRQVEEQFNDNSEAIDVLKKSAPIGVFFLIGYILIDSRSAIASGTITVSPYHWLALATILFFFGLTWLPAFRAHWRMWSLLCCLAMMILMIQASAVTGEANVRYVTILLCPFATASFVIWGWRWQLGLVIACIVLYALAEILLPIGPPFETHRLLGLAAALTLSQVTAVFLGRYRSRLHRQLTQLAEAAAFRETQIATMTHDIRNPLATLVGLVTVLIEDDMDDQQRGNLLSRVWSTTASMDLLVKNVLDLYLLEEQRLKPNRRLIDANVVVAETAEQVGIEARLKGLKLRVELGHLPKANLDPLHLERITANLLASAIKRTTSGAIALRTLKRCDRIVIEVSDAGPPPSPAEIGHIFERPSMASEAKSPALSRYIARALILANDGTIEASSCDEWGLTLTVSLPIGVPLLIVDAEAPPTLSAAAR
ncbi:MAG: HAMP domain-containing sensor histidine kinase [Candidatus Binataceae bacterium]